MGAQGTKAGSTWGRLGWFVGLWAASVVTLGIVGAILKWVLST